MGGLLDDELNARFGAVNGKCDSLQREVNDNEMAIVENYESQLATSSAVTDIELALTEIYEAVLGG